VVFGTRKGREVVSTAFEAPCRKPGSKRALTVPSIVSAKEIAE